MFIQPITSNLLHILFLTDIGTFYRTFLTRCILLGIVGCFHKSYFMKHKHKKLESLYLSIIATSFEADIG